VSHRDDLEHAILEHWRTIRRLEALPRTEAELIDGIRARVDDLLDELAACPAH
jgi:hypothetical protein